MPGRFDLRPLLGGALLGLRRRRAIGAEPVDGSARYILVGVPLVSAAVLTALQVQLADPGILSGGAALLIGALLAGFAMLAGWKDRLVERERQTERLQVRALDEAGAHILMSVIMAVVATAALGTLANVPVGGDAGAFRLWLCASLGGVGVGALVYIGLSVVIVVNLMWDAYEATSSRGRGSRAA